jgi:H+/Cl- antiporter ClcA
MVGFFSGVTQAPITAFVIVLEMVDNHETILPLMATAFIAERCSKLICPTPLFHSLAQHFFRKY